MKWLIAFIFFFSLASESKSPGDHLDTQPKNFFVFPQGPAHAIHGHFENLNLADFKPEESHYSCEDINHFRRFHFVGSQDSLMHLGRQTYVFLPHFGMVAAFDNKKACEKADFKDAHLVGEIAFQNIHFPNIRAIVAYDKWDRIEIDGPPAGILLGRLVDHGNPAPSPTPVPAPVSTPIPTPTVVPTPTPFSCGNC